MIVLARFLWAAAWLLLGASAAQAAGASQAAARIFPQAVIISQAVSGVASPTVTMSANYGPVASSASAGLDVSGETKQVVALPTAIPAMGLSGDYGNGTKTQAGIIQLSLAYIQTQLPTYVPQLVAYAKSVNANRVYYTLDQEILPYNATSSKRLVWTVAIDDQGHVTYGQPSVYAASPGFVYVSYTPLNVESDLPQSWQYTNAGIVTYQLFSTTGTALSRAETVATNGAFDAPQASSAGADNDAGLKCLMDTTSSSTCPQAYPSVRAFIANLSASFAIVDYLRMVAPVYNTVETPTGSGIYTQLPAVSVGVTLRTWYYQSCTAKSFHNTGYYGYTLLTTIDRYYVKNDGSYSKLASYSAARASPYQYYDYTRGLSDGEFAVLGAYMIDPSNPSGSLLAVSDVPYLVQLAGLSEGASQAPSPYNLTSNGSYGSGYDNSAHDHIIEFAGSVYTGYSDSTTYMGTSTFNISNVSQVSIAKILSVTGTNDVASIDVNGTTVYSNYPGIGGRIWKCEYKGNNGRDWYGSPYFANTSPENASYSSFCSEIGAQYVAFYSASDDYGNMSVSASGTYFSNHIEMANNYGAMTGNAGTINQSILPYLVNGQNTVSFHSVIGGYGGTGSGGWDIKFEIIDSCG